MGILVGLAGGTLGMLMAGTIWVLTEGLSESLRYFAGGLVGMAAGWWVGGVALSREGYQIT